MFEVKLRLAFCPSARMGVATERMFSWIQVRYTNLMSHAQPYRGDHVDYVDISSVGKERSCRREGLVP